MEYEHPQITLNMNGEHEKLDVILFSEFPLSYPGGGERLIRLIHDYLKNAAIGAKIIENSHKQGVISMSNENSSSDISKVEFVRTGLAKFLYQELPPLSIIPSEENTISLIFLRRVPPRSILRKIEQAEAKVIFCLHGVALETVRITSPLIIAHQLLMRIKLRDLAQYTRKRIFVQSLTPHVTSYLVTNGADSKNIFTIENQFESEILSPKRNDEEFQVIFIGRMEDLQKGIKRLRNVVRLVSRLNDNIKFNIIGSGKDIKKLNGLNGNVNILTGIDDNRKNEILASSNLAIITSNLDPLPRVALEFLTSGVSIISTPVAGPSYILDKDPSFGKVISFSAKSLARAVVACYREWEKDKDQYFHLREEIFFKARTIFNSQKMLESYRQMIIQVGKLR